MCRDAAGRGLSGRIPVVDHQFASGHEFGFVRGRVKRAAGDVIGFADMADGMLGILVLPEIFR